MTKLNTTRAGRMEHANNEFREQWVRDLASDANQLEDELARVRDNFDKVTRKLNDAAARFRERIEEMKIVDADGDEWGGCVCTPYEEAKAVLDRLEAAERVCACLDTPTGDRVVDQQHLGQAIDAWRANCLENLRG